MRYWTGAYVAPAYSGYAGYYGAYPSYGYSGGYAAYPGYVYKKWLTVNATDHRPNLTFW